MRFALGAPDQGFLGVGKSSATKVRHGVGFSPYHVIQKPEAKILQRCADAVDIVIGANHPERSRILKHPARLGEPGAGKGVIGSKILELIPIVCNASDTALVVGSQQLAAELKVVRRVRKDKVDRIRLKLCHLPATIADN